MCHDFTDHFQKGKADVTECISNIFLPSGSFVIIIRDTVLIQMRIATTCYNICLQSNLTFIKEDLMVFAEKVYHCFIQLNKMDTSINTHIFYLNESVVIIIYKMEQK
ncbi:unnamed protein product [Paramecium octaurelia]|uniref:Uncharacterized protein n=1 Tax=Paramecium octaurelia TaxID=43137 RepID=A0A8S1YSH8_PAROT|nr:unnamed protein product [Paramecium octaurelia]CAD8215154.1 unnamed protein product [Paramecium octaurelia]